MQLTYTDNCPKGWNAPGFKTCTDQNLIIGHAGSKGQRAESVSTGHHKYVFFNAFQEVSDVANHFLIATASGLFYSTGTSPTYGLVMASLVVPRST